MLVPLLLLRHKTQWKSEKRSAPSAHSFLSVYFLSVRVNSPPFSATVTAYFCNVA